MCLKADTGISIYGEGNLVEKFQYATQLKMDANDGLPSILCERCIARLTVCYEFRRQSILSDRHLRAFIQKVNSEFKEVASSSAATTMTLNDEEMGLLLEAGYKSDEISVVEDSTSNVKSEKDGVKDDNIQYIPDLDGYIQEDVTETYRVEEIQFQDGDEGSQIEDDGIEEEYHVDENTQLESIENEDESSNIEYIETKTIDPLAKSTARSHICTKCDKDFSTKTNLMRHVLTHSGVKPYQCNICGNGFTQNGSLKQHMLIHTGERPYKCQVCGRGFTQSKSLTFHMRRHTGEKPFTCEKCGLTFRQKDGLKRHMQMKHLGAAAEAHICSICQRILQSNYSLALHMKKHTGNNSKYKCEICEKTFSTKSSLENHTRQHTDEISSNILETTIEMQ